MEKRIDFKPVRNMGDGEIYIARNITVFFTWTDGFVDVWEWTGDKTEISMLPYLNDDTFNEWKKIDRIDFATDAEGNPDWDDYQEKVDEYLNSY